MTYGPLTSPSMSKFPNQTCYFRTMQSQGQPWKRGDTVRHATLAKAQIRHSLDRVVKNQSIFFSEMLIRILHQLDFGDLSSGAIDPGWAFLPPTEVRAVEVEVQTGHWRFEAWSPVFFGATKDDGEKKSHHLSCQRLFASKCRCFQGKRLGQRSRMTI